jgi:hypothetical protein
LAKIKHTRNENGKNFRHQNKTTLFWRKKAKINLHQNFPIYGTSEVSITKIQSNLTYDVAIESNTNIATVGGK